MISADIDEPHNPYAMGMCGGIPGYTTLSASVATNANISDTSTLRKLNPSFMQYQISEQKFHLGNYPYTNCHQFFSVLLPRNRVYISQAQEFLGHILTFMVIHTLILYWFPGNFL